MLFISPVEISFWSVPDFKCSSGGILTRAIRLFSLNLEFHSNYATQKKKKKKKKNTKNKKNKNKEKIVIIKNDTLWDATVGKALNIPVSSTLVLQLFPSTALLSSSIAHSFNLTGEHSRVYILGDIVRVPRWSLLMIKQWLVSRITSTDTHLGRYSWLYLLFQWTWYSSSNQNRESLLTNIQHFV